MLHSDARAEQLAIARIVVFGLWFLIIARMRVTQFELIPEELIQPPGLMRLIPLETLLSSPTILIVLKALALVGCALCVIGFRPYVPVAVGTAILILFHDGAMKSIGGYVNHSQVVLLLVTIILAIFPAADAYSLRGSWKGGPSGERWRYATPMLISALVIAIPYCFLGVRRLVAGGVGIYTGDSMTLWAVSRSLEYSNYDFDLGLLVLENSFFPVLMAVGMLIVTFFEVVAPLTLRYGRLRVAWIAVIVSFHFVTLLTMRIFFWHNVILIFVFFTKFTRVVVAPQAALRRLTRLRARLSAG
jgi:hypothetical protein